MRRTLFLALALLWSAPAAAQVPVFDYSGECAEAEGGGCEATEDWLAANGEEVKDKFNALRTVINALDATTDGVCDSAAAVVDDSLVAADFANANWGDVSVANNVITLNAGVVAAVEMANADHGDVAWTGGSAAVQSLQDDIVVAADLADGNWGEVSVSTNSVTLNADVVGPDEMANVDHGDVAWSGGAAAVQAVQANSVALTTGTTGNYVATIADSGASEVTVVNGSGSEGAAVTLAIASTLTRDIEVSALTVTTANIADPGTDCNPGDVYLDTDAVTEQLCVCLVGGATDNWACVTLVD